MTDEAELRRWREGLEQALRRRQRSPTRRFLKVVAIGLLVSVISAGTAAAFYWRQLSAIIVRTPVDVEPAVDGIYNILVIGSDSREGLTTRADRNKFGRVDGRRSDTIILMQADVPKRRAVLVHFPRDLWLDIPGHGKGKINTAYQEGPQVLIDTVQLVSGVPVNHYVEVNIAGFRNMVNALGGIDVCLDRQIYDREWNFKLPAGANHLDGDDALNFVRTRRADGDGDFGRIRRQQQFLRAVVEKVGSPSILLNPVRLKSLADTFASNIRADNELNLAEMLRLAPAVRAFSPSQMQTYTVPGDIGRASGQSVVLLDADRADVLFGALRDVADPAERLAPSPVELTVEDATGKGTAASVAEQLKARGFVIAAVTPGTKVQSTTRIIAPRRLANDAKRVQAVVPGAPILYGGSSVKLVVGSKFKALAPQPKGEAPATEGPCANWGA